MTKRIGTICIDTGMVWIGDPVTHAGSMLTLSDELVNEDADSKTDDSTVVASTGLGDGYYCFVLSFLKD